MENQKTSRHAFADSFCLVSLLALCLNTFHRGRQCVVTSSWQRHFVIILALVDITTTLLLVLVLLLMLVLQVSSGTGTACAGCWGSGRGSTSCSCRHLRWRSGRGGKAPFKFRTPFWSHFWARLPIPARSDLWSSFRGAGADWAATTQAGSLQQSGPILTVPACRLACLFKFTIPRNLGDS